MFYMMNTWALMVRTQSAIQYSTASIRLSHEDTKQIHLWTVWHDDYSLFIEQKQVIIKVFFLISFVLTRLWRRRRKGWTFLWWQRRWRGCKGRQDRQAHLVSLYRNAPSFLSGFFAFSFLQNDTNTSSTICFGFSACIIEESMM